MKQTELPPVREILRRLQNEIEPLCLPDTLLVGVHTGGVWLAEQLHQSLGLTSALGTLDISFYRDDFSRIGLHPKVKGSLLPETVEDRDVILIDDVLHSGRTVRAALNEIFSFGRPARVRLGVLVERSGRELPIQADFVGLHLDLEPDQYIELSGPHRMRLELIEGKCKPSGA